METVFLQLREALGKSPPRSLEPPPPFFRESAVLVPLFVREGALHVVFTRRKDSLKSHAGQISFPGGTKEAEDRDFLETALRETEEELGISKAQVQVLGALDEVQTITQFRIFPFVGAIPPNLSYQANPSEVEHVIEAPIKALLDPAIHRVERRQVQDIERELFFYDYGTYVIWGATARILRNLLQWVVALPGWRSGFDG